jgi:hypothetical protein
VEWAVIVIIILAAVLLAVFPMELNALITLNVALVIVIA